MPLFSNTMFGGYSSSGRELGKTIFIERERDFIYSDIMHKKNYCVTTTLKCTKIRQYNKIFFIDFQIFWFRFHSVIFACR